MHCEPGNVQACAVPGLCSVQQFCKVLERVCLVEDATLSIHIHRLLLVKFPSTRAYDLLPDDDVATISAGRDVNMVAVLLSPNSIPFTLPLTLTQSLSSNQPCSHAVSTASSPSFLPSSSAESSVSLAEVLGSPQATCISPTSPDGSSLLTSTTPTASGRKRKPFWSPPCEEFVRAKRSEGWTFPQICQKGQKLGFFRLTTTGKELNLQAKSVRQVLKRLLDKDEKSGRLVSSRNTNDNSNSNTTNNITAGNGIYDLWTDEVQVFVKEQRAKRVSWKNVIQNGQVKKLFPLDEKIICFDKLQKIIMKQFQKHQPAADSEEQDNLAARRRDADGSGEQDFEMADDAKETEKTETAGTTVEEVDLDGSNKGQLRRSNRSNNAKQCSDSARTPILRSRRRQNKSIGDSVAVDRKPGRPRKNTSPDTRNATATVQTPSTKRKLKRKRQSAFPEQQKDDHANFAAPREQYALEQSYRDEETEDYEEDENDSEADGDGQNRQSKSRHSVNDIESNEDSQIEQEEDQDCSEKDSDEEEDSSSEAEKLTAKNFNTSDGGRTAERRPSARDGTNQNRSISVLFSLLSPKRSANVFACVFMNFFVGKRT